MTQAAVIRGPAVSLRWRRWLLPAAVFLAAGLAHFLWLDFFPERDLAQDRWATVPTQQKSWLRSYVETQSYWLGFSYGLSLAFAAVALRRYREGHFCTSRNMAIGGVTFSGVLSVAGCYLIGCCGSPMLGVYIGLFGAAFIPWAKPIAAGVTVLSIGTAWWWMDRQERAATSDSSGPNCCTGPDDRGGQTGAD